jgi:hypothetical protein
MIVGLLSDSGPGEVGESTADVPNHAVCRGGSSGFFRHFLNGTSGPVSSLTWIQAHSEKSE